MSDVDDFPYMDIHTGQSIIEDSFCGTKYDVPVLCMNWESNGDSDGASIVLNGTDSVDKILKMFEDKLSEILIKHPEGIIISFDGAMVKSKQFFVSQEL